MVHRHRLLLLGFKVATFAAWWVGVPDRLIAAVVTPWAIWRVVTIYRAGKAEEYREPWAAKVARLRADKEDPINVRVVAAGVPAPAPPPHPRPVRAISAQSRAPHELALP